jgi:hypothetical protein
MAFSVWIVLTLAIFLPIISVTFAETNQSEIDQSISREERRFFENEKTHYLIAQWQTAEDPIRFAQENRLVFHDDKIAVYIYLENSDLISEVPSNIEIKRSDRNKITAFVTSEQIFQLETLDFVQKITPPELAQTPPIPKMKELKPQIDQKTPPNFQLWILFLILSIIVSFVIIMKTKRKNVH